jgi:hypothetical protein
MDMSSISNARNDFDTTCPTYNHEYFNSFKEKWIKSLNIDSETYVLQGNSKRFDRKKFFGIEYGKHCWQATETLFFPEKDLYHVALSYDNRYYFLNSIKNIQANLDVFNKLPGFLQRLIKPFLPIEFWKTMVGERHSNIAKSLLNDLEIDLKRDDGVARLKNAYLDDLNEIQGCLEKLFSNISLRESTPLGPIVANQDINILKEEIHAIQRKMNSFYLDKQLEYMPDINLKETNPKKYTSLLSLSDHYIKAHAHITGIFNRIDSILDSDDNPRKKFTDLKSKFNSTSYLSEYGQYRAIFNRKPVMPINKYAPDSYIKQTHNAFAKAIEEHDEKLVSDIQAGALAGALEDQNSQLKYNLQLMMNSKLFGDGVVIGNWLIAPLVENTRIAGFGFGFKLVDLDNIKRGEDYTLSFLITATNGLRITTLDKRHGKNELNSLSYMQGFLNLLAYRVSNREIPDAWDTYEKMIWLAYGSWKNFNHSLPADLLNSVLTTGELLYHHSKEIELYSKEIELSNWIQTFDDKAHHEMHMRELDLQQQISARTAELEEKLYKLTTPIETASHQSDEEIVKEIHGSIDDIESSTPSPKSIYKESSIGFFSQPPSPKSGKDSNSATDDIQYQKTLQPGGASS